MSSGLASALRSRGGGTGVAWLLSMKPQVVLTEDHPAEFLLGRESSGDEGIHVSSALFLFDRALGIISSSSHAAAEWTRTRVSAAWSANQNDAAGALSELEAFGTFLEVFPDCVPVPEAKTQTPDFMVPGLFSLECYRPRESGPNRNNVAKDLASQEGWLKIALSHPITGSDGLSLVYPASKVVDRIVNAKRASLQTNNAGILYVDLRHEWGIKSELLQPYVTVASQGEYWVGTFGAWHAFYGASRRRTMLRDRVTLRVLDEDDAHEQVNEGLFRAAPHWSATVLAASDGLVLLQNPWASSPLSETAVRKLLRLYGMRADSSWFEIGSEGGLAARVEHALTQMERTFQASV